MIIGAQINLRTSAVSRTPEEVLIKAVDLTERLARLHPLMKRWYSLPSRRKEKCIALEDSAAMLYSMERDVEKMRRQLGGFEGFGASLLLANVDNDRDWREPGLVVLNVSPGGGWTSLRINGLEPFGEDISSIMLGAMIESVKVIQPDFASTDVKGRSPESELICYQMDRRLYQHRQFFGWMGFVPAQVDHAQLPDAHAVHPIDGLGTVIVSVPGVFDPCDDAQVERVHRVERDLASRDLLPVTDPHFKG
ncbi:Imm52 family immunity protein [Stenotrophomonas sp. S39]|uniref:Imm52 family immunity protein n=1 Tax=Stenotrophomonas sp. S39 TaxID=2767451 RepID=UPI00190BD48D|nr:Imm52 family immunity protein [Stenotrophomonas sp. S39]MBK0055632.1 immunity 52 family protein [Stenotrophomonas sp. S39]